MMMFSVEEKLSSTATRGRWPQRSVGRRGCSAAALPKGFLLFSKSTQDLYGSRKRDTPSDFRACFAVSPATSPAIAVEEMAIAFEVRS